MKKRNIFFFMILVCCFIFSACGKKEEDISSTEEVPIVNGSVESSEDFIPLGLLIDVQQDNKDISNVRYNIVNSDIAVVSFEYNGIDCELRGSSMYSNYELVGKEDTSTGDITVGSVGGCGATYYTLKPGRVVFWNDDNIYYALYVYVTADNSVLENIIPYLIFENHYFERPDVKADIESESKVFAEQIVEVFQNKDVNTLAGMMYYPQQLGNGNSVTSANDLLSMPESELFTDGIIKVLDDDAAKDAHLSSDGESYIIGSSYKNIRFQHMDDGSFKIVYINN
jgi:hypothetical protein